MKSFLTKTQQLEMQENLEKEWHKKGLRAKVKYEELKKQGKRPVRYKIIQQEYS